MTALRQVSDLKQAIQLLHTANQLLYTTDCRLSDYQAVENVIVSLEADVQELLTHGQV